MPRTQQIDVTEQQLAQPPERSIAEIVRSITDDTTTLIRKELQLAREEVLEALTARAKAAAAFAAAGVLALFAAVFGGLAAAAALARLVPMWAAALIVCGGFLVAALAGVGFAVARISRPPLIPTETVRTIKEDVEWSKEQLKR